MSKRTEELKIRVPPEDKERIKLKMEDAGILTMSTYVRKMALDGICIRLDLKDVRQLISMLQWCTNNLNQYAKWANETRASMRRTLKICRIVWMRFGNCPDNPCQPCRNPMMAARNKTAAFSLCREAQAPPVPACWVQRYCLRGSESTFWMDFVKNNL